MNKIKWITPKIIIATNQMIIDNFGGTFKIKNFTSLQNVVKTLQKTHYTSQNFNLYEISACYCYLLIRGKFFQDGNKRTGFLVMISFLEENGINININEKIGFKIIKGIESGKWNIEDVLKSIY